MKIHTFAVDTAELDLDGVSQELQARIEAEISKKNDEGFSVGSIQVVPTSTAYTLAGEGMRDYSYRENGFIVVMVLDISCDIL